MRVIKFIFFSFILFWLCLFSILIISRDVINYRQGQEFTNILHTTSESILSLSPLYPWANFDGVHYLAIAKYGYTTDAGFFPLYPVMINVLSYLIGDYFLSGLILSNLFFISGLIIFYKLIRLDFTKEVSYQSVIFLLIFPTAFFFSAIYSESLFFLLLILSFYFARKRMWFCAALSGIFLSATRIVGVLILPALMWEFYALEKDNIRTNLKKFIPLLLVPFGLFSYMFFNFMNWGNPLYFIKAQGMLSNNRSVDQIILFPQTLFRYFKIITTVSYQQFEWWIALLEICITLLVLCLLFITYKQKVRVSYIIFSLFALLVPLSTGTLSGVPRYVLVAFPVFISIALMKNQLFKIVYSIASVFLLIILWMLFSKGYYVA
ncbi:MAG: mannosyltransferase family protein [Microgenomates group bacterium]|jgi:hypothetical protein